MPELPEVEILVRHLKPLILGKTIHSVRVNRPRVLRPTSTRRFKQLLTGAVFAGLTRRGKYLLFEIQLGGEATARLLTGHLGMTGRMYVLAPGQTFPKHSAVLLGLGEETFVFEDTRYFGRLTLDAVGLEELGPEPLSPEFTCERFARDLRRSAQPIKTKLLDQRLVAGIGNIYASEALFRAGISPRTPARRLPPEAVRRLWRAIRTTLAEAIRFGSTVPLNFHGVGGRDALFYYGRDPKTPQTYEERLRVYDREGLPCLRCGAAIKRSIQAARSTFFCPICQRRQGSFICRPKLLSP